MAAVATALLRRGALQAGAVLALAATPSPDVAVPNLRSLYEAFGELHYLLAADDADERARTAVVFAVRQMEDFQRQWGDDGQELARLRSELARYAEDMPEAHKTALSAR